MIIQYAKIQEILKNSIFFVWLSHKRWKNNEVLPAFEKNTKSWALIHSIIEELSEIIYLTNLIEWVPIDENWKLRYPNKEEKYTWANNLYQKIGLYTPKKVILFWKEASKPFIILPSIQQIWDLHYKLQKTEIFTVNHPSYISVYKRKEITEYKKKIISICLWFLPT